MKKCRASIADDLKLQLLGTYGAAFLGGICTLIIVHALGPHDYGVWSVLALLLVYADYTHCGILNALVQIVAIYRGQGSTKKMNDAHTTAYTAVLSLGLCVSLGWILFAFGFFASDCILSTHVIIGFAVILFLQHVFNYYKASFTATREFKHVCILLVGLQLVITMALTVLAVRYRMPGILAALILGYATILLYAKKTHRHGIPGHLNIPLLRQLFSVGVPIITASFSFMLMLTVERMVLITVLGREATGYYTIASLLSNYLILFPLSFESVLKPRLAESYGASGDRKALFALIKKPSIALMYCMLLCLVIMYYFLPHFIQAVMPHFRASVAPCQISILGVGFLSVGIAMRQILIVTNRARCCMWIALVVCGVKIILVYISTALQYGIVGVAYASVIAYVLFSFGLFSYATAGAFDTRFEWLRYAAVVYAPCLLLMMLAMVS